MPKRTRDHQSWLIEKLTDPARAAAYLNTARDDSREMFLEALRDVAQAHQMTRVAKKAGVTRESLYKVTSVVGNPNLDTFDSVLDALGLDYIIRPKEIAVAVVPPVKRIASAGRRTTRLSARQIRTGNVEVLRGYHQNVASGSYIGILGGLTVTQTTALPFQIDHGNAVSQELGTKILGPPISESGLPAFLCDMLNVRNNGRQDNASS